MSGESFFVFSFKSFSGFALTGGRFFCAVAQGGLFRPDGRGIWYAVTEKVSTSYGRVRRSSGGSFACVMHVRRTVCLCGGNVGESAICAWLRISAESRHSLPMKTPHGQSLHRHAGHYPVMLCNVLPLASVTPSALLHEGRSRRECSPKLQLSADG